MKRYLAEPWGFTMPEILVALVFAMILVASIYGFYRNQLFTLLAQDVKMATLEDARGALDLMVRELRNAGSWSSGIRPETCSKIVSATPSAIQIQADLDGNGNCGNLTGEDVTYMLAAGTKTCPGTTIRRNGGCLISSVNIPEGAEFLTYYAGGSTTPLAHPIPDLSMIRRVKITLAVGASSPGPDGGGTIASTLSSSVELRNR